MTERPDPYREIREHLIERRKARGWSQRDLAKAAGIVQSAISDLESGKVAEPAPKTLRAWAGALDAQVRIIVEITEVNVRSFDVGA